MRKPSQIISNIYRKILNNLEKQFVFDNETEFIEDEKEIKIKDTNKQWFIEVPICTESGKVIYERLFADTGANAACVKTSWH